MISFPIISFNNKMLSLKIAFLFCSFYMIYAITNSEYLSIPDENWIKVQCNPILDGYEYKNIVIEKKGVTPNDPPISCYASRYPLQNMELSFTRPNTYGYAIRFINAFIFSAIFYVFFFYNNFS